MVLRKFVMSLFLISSPAFAAISVQDDSGNTVTLERPAQRVASLAPHATEVVFAAGGGDRIVATVTYSDYPLEARSIQRVGDNRQVDMERLIALKPDLVIAWRHNASTRQVEQVRALGIPLYYSDPQRLDDIPHAVLRIGKLLGTEAQARVRAAELEQRIGMLAARFRNRSPVRVFYQVWGKPLYTVNGRNIISDALRLCGGENIFAHLTNAAPSLTPEALLQADPEAIISGDRQGQTESGTEMWKRYPTMLAVRRGNLFGIDADLVHRAGPRFVEGAEQLCERVERARQHRESRQ